MSWKLAVFALMAAGTVVALQPRARVQAEAPQVQTAAPSQHVPAPASLALRLVPAPEGNEARYRVREQLANLDFPSDAVGRTAAITGTIVLEDNGTVVRDASKLVVDLRTLESDSQMRDRYIQRNTLQTEQFPTAEFVPTAIDGLRMPLPTAGALTLHVTGDLTVHGVSRPATWEVTVQALPGAWSGTATTAFSFADFGMTIPRVARVLSVRDTIRLEYDFRLIPPAAN